MTNDVAQTISGGKVYLISCIITYPDGTKKVWPDHFPDAQSERPVFGILTPGKEDTNSK